MVNFLIIVLVAAILALAVGYIRRSKKKGMQCIGCPCSGQCSGSCSCGEKDSSDF